MRSRRGFTLVELLVVIAILGILAGFVAAGLPGVLRRAKIASTRETMRQIQTILTAYYTDNNSLPPAYGYLSDLFLRYPQYSNPTSRPQDILDELVAGTNGMEQRDVYFLIPWMAALREHGNEDLYDNWSRTNGFDTDGDDLLSRLEYSPIGQYDAGSQTYTFGFTELYLGENGSNNTDPVLLADLDDPVQQDGQLNVPGPRPFIYVPVNERQARIFRQIIYDASGSANPRPFNLSGAAVTAIETQLSFPPPSYDAYVLISIGPNFVAGTNGIIVDWDTMGLDNFDPEYATVNQYHLLGLATYFMATRDANNNNELDYDYQARVSRGEGRDSNNDMPGLQPKGAGPLIFVGN